MGLALDYETSNVEGITLRLSKKDGDMFLKNYSHFGWKLISKLSVDGYDDLYSYILERNKNHANYEQLKELENEFLRVTKEIKVKDPSALFIAGNVNPDYIDYERDKPLSEIYKLTTGTIILNTLACFILIGFLMWLDTAKKLAIDNKKAVKNNELQTKIKEIFRKAEDLL